MSSDMNDMNDMSNQPIFADDWAPATLGNVNISTVTFTVDGTDDTVTAEFPSAMEAFDSVSYTHLTLPTICSV